ncbi:molybdate ABC transporter substrate-binding protein [Marinobacteraceae bacterium S3BR75-40.1]
MIFGTAIARRRREPAKRATDTLTGIVMAVVLALSSGCSEANLTVAVASNFTAPMRALMDRFQTQTGIRVDVAYGSSGKLFAQIQHGAPYQVFLSADQSKPEALLQAGHGVEGTAFTYAVGQLALWSPDPEKVDDQGAILASGDFRQLAIANPRLAPYGQAAQDVLRHLGLLKRYHARLVMGENIAQTFQFVDSGNAELGFVAVSQIMQDGKVTKGSAWLVPHALYSPIRQDALLLQDSESARALLEFLQTPESRALIESFGYQTEAGH